MNKITCCMLYILLMCCLSCTSQTNKSTATTNSKPAKISPGNNYSEGKDYTIQRLLIGTHTSDNDQNYVEIANVQLPKSDSDVDPRKYEEEKAGFISHMFEVK